MTEEEEVEYYRSLKNDYKRKYHEALDKIEQLESKTYGLSKYSIEDLAMEIEDRGQEIGFL